MKKGSREAKAWGRRMKALRGGKVYKTASPNSNMAKRKRTGRKSFSRKSRMFGSTNIVKTAVIGGAMSVLYEMYLSPKIPIANPLIKNGAEAVLGFYLSKKSGVLGDFGKVLLIENIYTLLVSNIGAIMPNITSTTNAGGQSIYF